MKKISLIMLLFAQLSFSQKEKLISGKLIAKERLPQNVHIINLVNEKETISNEKGEFKILAKENDLLVFSSNNFNYERKIIETIDYTNGTIIIQLTEKPEQLEEVVIRNNNDINAVSLGILSKPAKTYTPAERRLKTATDIDVEAIGGSMAGAAVSTDFLINKITGRTKKLKKEVKIERKQLLIKKLENDFTESFYLNNLKIKKEQINAFQYFCAEDEQFAKTMKSKNKTLIMFKLKALAIKFKNLNEKN